MAVRPNRLTERDFEAGITRTPWALVRLERSSSAFHAGLAETLDARWPGLFTFATLARSDLRDQAFPTQAFHSSVGVIRGGVRDGYWLFEAGLVVGHHTGVPRPSNVSYGYESSAEEGRARVSRHAGPHPDPREVETVRQILEVFEPIVDRRQRASGFADEVGASSSSSSSSSWSAPAAPPRAASEDPDDPYLVLGVAPTATNDEIKAAFREQMKLNHPDKVAHLSPALRAFAHAQVLRIKDAFERLSKRPR